MAFWKRKRQGVKAVRSVLTSKNDSPLSQIIGVNGLDRRMFTLLVKYIPFVNAGVGKFSGFIGAPEIRLDNEKTTETLQEYLKNIPLNTLSQGFKNLNGLIISDTIIYGFALAEILFNEGQRASSASAARSS